MEQPRVMTPGSSLSERLGLSSASSPMGPHGLNEDSMHSPLLRTPGGSLISAIQDSIRQMSEGSLKASQDILDKISIDDNDDDDDDDNYITLTMNDLNKAPISIEGAHSRPSTQYMPGGGSVTLDLNKVANAIDILKHEYHDNPASFANRVIPITNKNEIAEKIRNAKAKKMPIGIHYMIIIITIIIIITAITSGQTFKSPIYKTKWLQCCLRLQRLSGG